jgi:hypothetical protein
MTNSARRCLAPSAVLCGVLALSSRCHLERARSSEAFDSATLPDDVRDDYALFAQRCSKCHSLARPLQSGISDEEYWHNYVERMRRQPGSGITPGEAPRILHFLRYYSAAWRARGVLPQPYPGGTGAPLRASADADAGARLEGATGVEGGPAPDAS